MTEERKVRVSGGIKRIEGWGDTSKGLGWKKWNCVWVLLTLALATNRLLADLHFLGPPRPKLPLFSTPKWLYQSIEPLVAKGIVLEPKVLSTVIYSHVGLHTLSKVQDKDTGAVPWPGMQAILAPGTFPAVSIRTAWMTIFSSHGSSVPNLADYQILGHLYPTGPQRAFV